MKKLFFLCLTIFIGNNPMAAQNIQQIDSLGATICNTLSKDDKMKADEKIQAAFQTHLVQYFQKMKVSSQEEADSIGSRIYFRMQKNCPVFSQLLTSLQENKSDWIILKEKPAATISKSDYKTFLGGGNFYYKEYNGSIVNVVVTKTTWTETFEDGTTSKLSFVPKGNNEFDLVFIESNNETRKNFSVKGDTYKYGLYEKTNDGLLAWTSSEDNKLHGFKLYKK